MTKFKLGDYVKVNFKDKWINAFGVIVKVDKLHYMVKIFKDTARCRLFRDKQLTHNPVGDSTLWKVMND